MAYAEPYNIELLERLFFDENVNKEVLNDGNNLAKVVKQLNPHNIGIAEKVFAPNETATRVQAAQMIYNAVYR